MMIIIASLAILLLLITMLADRGRLGSFRWPLLTARADALSPNEAFVRARIDAAVAQERARIKAEERSRESFRTGEPKWAAIETEAEKTQPAPAADSERAGILTVTALAAKKLSSNDNYHNCRHQ